MSHPRWFLAVCLAFCVFSSVSVFAATSQVGTCNSVTGNFTTIQAAVNGSNAGDTINICPGSYSEQVTINKSLTVQAVSVTQNGGDVVNVVVPAGGVTANGTTLSWFPVAAQIFVSNATGVTISGLTVNAQGNGLSGCGTEIIGIYFQNASGTVNGNAVLNDALDTADNGCQDGEGIFVESGNSGTSTVTVSQNIVANYQKNGITGNGAGTTVTVTNNSVVGQGPTTGAAENGIQIAFGAAGMVTSNSVTDDVWIGSGYAASGILVYASHAVSITSN